MSSPSSRLVLPARWIAASVHLAILYQLTAPYLRERASLHVEYQFNWWAGLILSEVLAIPLTVVLVLVARFVQRRKRLVGGRRIVGALATGLYALSTAAVLAWWGLRMHEAADLGEVVPVGPMRADTLAYLGVAAVVCLATRSRLEPADDRPRDVKAADGAV